MSRVDVLNVNVSVLNAETKDSAAVLKNERSYDHCCYKNDINKSTSGPGGAVGLFRVSLCVAWQ